jgi:hypothetical protein
MKLTGISNMLHALEWLPFKFAVMVELNIPTPKPYICILQEQKVNFSILTSVGEEKHCTLSPLPFQLF